MPTGMVCTLKQKNSSEGGAITKKPMWTFDVDYATQSSISSYLRFIVSSAMCDF